MDTLTPDLRIGYPSGGSETMISIDIVCADFGVLLCQVARF